MPSALVSVAVWPPMPTLTSKVCPAGRTGRMHATSKLEDGPVSVGGTVHGSEPTVTVSGGLVSVVVPST
jgi:hypothetical protein